MKKKIFPNLEKYMTSCKMDLECRLNDLHEEKNGSLKNYSDLKEDCIQTKKDLEAIKKGEMTFDIFSRLHILGLNQKNINEIIEWHTKNKEHVKTMIPIDRINSIATFLCFLGESTLLAIYQNPEKLTLLKKQMDLFLIPFCKIPEFGNVIINFLNLNPQTYNMIMTNGLTAIAILSGLLSLRFLSNLEYNEKLLKNVTEMEVEYPDIFNTRKKEL